MSIVLDTNVLPQNGDVGAIELQVIIGLARERGLSVVLPELVVAEWAAKIERDARAAWDAARVALEKAGRWADVPELPSLDAAAVAATRAEELAALVEVRAVPEGAWREALEREVRRERPTREGRGARDAAIWLTALEVAVVEDGDTWFVSGNTKDFGSEGAPTVLHQRLREELGEPPVLAWAPGGDELVAALASRTTEKMTVTDLEGVASAPPAVIRALETSVLEGLEIPLGSDGLGGRYIAGPVAVEPERITRQETFIVEDAPLALVSVDWLVRFEVGLIRRVGAPGMAQETATVTLRLGLQMWIRGELADAATEVVRVGRVELQDVR